MIDERALKHAEYALTEKWPLTDRQWKNGIVRYIIEAYESAKEQQPNGESVLDKHTLEWAAQRCRYYFKNQNYTGENEEYESGVDVACSNLSSMFEKEASQSPPHDTGIGKDDVERAFEEWAKNRPALVDSSTRLNALYIWQAAIAAMPRPATGWMPIENAPNGTCVLLSLKQPNTGKRVNKVMIGRFDGSFWNLFGGTPVRDKDIVKWMPLPPAPEGE